MNEKRFCSSCGKALTSTDAFCAGCGKSLNDETSQSDGISPAAPVPPQAQPSKKKGGISGCFTVIILFVVLSALAHSCDSSTSSSGNRSSDTSHNDRTHKAIADVDSAATIGSLSDDEKSEYRAGLQHVLKTHAKLGNYTIAQVIEFGIPPTPVPTQDPYIAEGTPSCLKLKSMDGNSDEYTAHITGTAVNTCDRNFSYVQISFNILDSSGSVTGSALANVNHIQAGESWKFDAISTAPSSSWKFRFSEMTGF